MAINIHWARTASGISGDCVHLLCGSLLGRNQASLWLYWIRRIGHLLANKFRIQRTRLLCFKHAVLYIDPEEEKPRCIELMLYGK